MKLWWLVTYTAGSSAAGKCSLPSTCARAQPEGSHASMHALRMKQAAQQGLPCRPSRRRETEGACLHAVVGCGGDLGPDVVHGMLRQAPVAVKQPHKRRQQQHGRKERQRQHECGRVEYEALHRCQDGRHPAHRLLCAPRGPCACMHAEGMSTCSGVHDRQHKPWVFNHMRTWPGGGRRRMAPASPNGAETAPAVLHATCRPLLLALFRCNKLHACCNKAAVHPTAH